VAREDGGIARYLDGLVPAYLAEAYGKIYELTRIPKEEAAAFLGGEELVKELLDRGLAHNIPRNATSPATFAAAPIALAMQALLTDLQAKVLESQRLLLAGQRTLSEIQVLPGGLTSDSPEHLVKVITDSVEIARISAHLINTARREFISLETAAGDMPMTEDNLVSCPEGLRGQVRIRSIYDVACTRDPARLRMLERAVEDGEEARIHPRVPLKLQLIDEAHALLPLTTTGTRGAVLFGEGPITSGLRFFCEMLWKESTPFGSRKQPSGCPLTEVQVGIVNLMMQGLTDKEIASSLKQGVSTVRRHIDASAALAGDPGNRFALGVTLERRGWLPTDKESHA